MYTQTFTLTFSESVENHAGMQIIGNKCAKGFDEDYVRGLACVFDAECIELGDMSQPDACICIFRDGLRRIFDINPDELYSEQDALEKDTKAFMYGRVVNKKARYNLCFADSDQDADYNKKKGTILNFERLKLLNQLREKLGVVLGEQFENLYAEGNYYYDIKKTFIGWHGDTERSKVLGVRLGATFPLHFRWYENGKVNGDINTIELSHGDIYIMSQKATGNDWKKRSTRWTLRHSAGNLKNIKD